ncbi:MAG TPA: GerMN domain-containing protein [Candidatus Blautia merdigallinarum]|uniref:GerMN domain-containing protein n=1 Tax=Candidatus Blautia merdigallinarum TaxID=2838495 RepID=A0A9D2SKM0_9FIRM|nr:GerMN domain-containing protein [Candidatus Blautia merdigallinarum]
MRNIKRILAVFLSFCLLTAAGCRENQEEKTTEYSMYYLALSETKLETVPYEPSEQSAETMVEEIYQLLSQPSDSEEYLKLLPEEVLMKNYTFEGQTVTLNFDEAYKKMNNVREILVRTGMVLAFTQIPGVTYVEFLENGNPMTDSDGNELGRMERGDFVENEGKNINSYVFADLNLYFANEDGDHLVREARRIHYSSNVPLERVIVEKLLEGPKEDGMLPVLSSNTKILGVSIVEGICYVNFDKSFLTETMSVQQELSIYSIVNSLTDACKIHGVQISVEGDTKVTFRESMGLDQIYQADYSYLGSEDES